MATAKGRASKLRFVLNYAYNVPGEILDKIDVDAYADPNLTFVENLELLMRFFPTLKKYIEPDAIYEADHYAEEWEHFLLTTLQDAIMGNEQALETMKAIGFDSPKEFAETLIKEGLLTEEEWKEMREVASGSWAEGADEVKEPNYNTRYVMPELTRQVEEFAKTAPRDVFARHLEEQFGVRKRYLYPEKYFGRGICYVSKTPEGYYNVVRRELTGQKMNFVKANYLRGLVETYFNRFLKEQVEECSKPARAEVKNQETAKLPGILADEIHTLLHKFTVAFGELENDWPLMYLTYEQIEKIGMNNIPKDVWERGSEFYGAFKELLGLKKEIDEYRAKLNREELGEYEFTPTDVKYLERIVNKALDDIKTIKDTYLEELMEEVMTVNPKEVVIIHKLPLDFRDKTGKEVLAEYDGAKAIANYDDKRVWVVFDHVPPEALRKFLRSKGFLWSPKRKAWVRKLTYNAIHDAVRVLEEYKRLRETNRVQLPEKKEAPSKPTVSEAEVEKLRHSWELYGHFDIKKAYELLEQTGRKGWVTDAFKAVKAILPCVSSECKPVGDRILRELILKALEPNATKMDVYNEAKVLAKMAKNELEKEQPQAEVKPEMRKEEPMMADKVILINALAREVINRTAKAVAKRTGDMNPVLDKGKEKSDTEYKVWWMLKPKKGATDKAFAHVIYVEVGMYRREDKWVPSIVINMPANPSECARGSSEPLTWDDVKNRRDEVAKEAAEYIWKWFDCVQGVKKPEMVEEKPTEEKPQPKPEETPLEPCIKEKEALLWNIYEAEFRLKGLKAEKPAWLRELAGKVCREEMDIRKAMAEALRRAKVDIANEIYHRVVGKRTVEIVDLEKPPKEKEKSVVEEVEVPVEEHGEVKEEPLEEAVEEVDVENALINTVRQVARPYGDPDEFIDALPIVELTHAVQEGRMSLDDAKDLLRMAIVEGRKPELLARVDWAKVLGKRGKIDTFWVEDKLTKQLEKLTKEVAKVGRAKSQYMGQPTEYIVGRKPTEIPTRKAHGISFTYGNIDIPIETILANWDLILRRGLRFALHDITGGWLSKKVEEEFIKWWWQLLRSKYAHIPRGELTYREWLISMFPGARELWSTVFTFGIDAPEVKEYLHNLYVLHQSTLQTLVPGIGLNGYIKMVKEFIEKEVPEAVSS